MDVILVPGFWLDASSWSAVTPPLVAAGHRVHPLTLPGLESMDVPRAGIGLRDHVDAVVAAVDAVGHPAVLVGHSGGGALIHAAADARPDLVVRTIYVDCVPLGEGDVINDELPAIGDEVPLPARKEFDDVDLTDLDDDLWAAFRARAIPEPVAVTRDQQHLHDERRFDVPATVIACEFPARQLVGLIESGDPYTAELGRLHNVEYIDLPTGHWPQFTKPTELGEAILAALSASGTR